MTAEERYEWAWKQYLVRLNKNSKIRLTTFLREVHVYQRGMERWMYAKGLSVMETKRLIRESQNQAKYERLLPSSDTTGSMFLPVTADGADGFAEAAALAAKAENASAAALLADAEHKKYAAAKPKQRYDFDF